MRTKIVLLTFFSGIIALILAQQVGQTQPASGGGTSPNPPPAGATTPQTPPPNAMPPFAGQMTPNNVTATQNISTQSLAGQTFSTNLSFPGTNGFGGTNMAGTNFGGVSVTGGSNATARPGMGFGASTNSHGVFPWKGPADR
ncbi:MAG TPA: hypothetical protein VN625_04710 [Desulfuromonadaceae bacterium]|nr:hypothetical protein [Desulfuromonadaceae bacterium]